MIKHFTPRTLFSLLNPVVWGGIIACLNLFFWYIIDGFRVIPIDMLDGRLILAIHEHWFQVFSGKISWNDLPLFWPLENTLGFSDAFFLTSIPYAIARWLGADLYASFIWMEASIALIGYFSFYQLLRSLVKIPRYLSILLAFLFINTSLTHNAIAHSHPQLLIIWLIPPFFLMVHSAILDPRFKGYLLAAISGLWLGLLFLTGYYISWYFIFFLTLFFALSILWSVFFRTASRSLLTAGFVFLCHERRYFKLSLFLISFALSLIPFFQLYLPINKVYGQREWGEMSIIVPSYKEFFNQGTYNWMWSNLIKAIGWFPEKWPQYRSMGFGPILFFAFIASSFYTKMEERRSHSINAIISLLIFTTVVCLGLNFRIGEFTLWKYIHDFVPGASPIRAFHRFNFVLLLPLLIVIGWAFKNVPKEKLSLHVYLIFFVIILEQQSSRVSDYAMPYGEATSRIAHIQAPPSEASVFYLRRSIKSDMWQFPQLDAFFVAQKYNLKTVNGYSGIYPKNWWLYDPSEAWYPKEVLRWIGLNGAEPSGLYELNWDTGHWIKRD